MKPKHMVPEMAGQGAMPTAFNSNVSSPSGSDARTQTGGWDGLPPLSLYPAPQMTFCPQEYCTDKRALTLGMACFVLSWDTSFVVIQ